MKNERLQWHPAFSAALRITLGDEMQYLDMREEYLLSKKPPQIDVLVIKKQKSIAIKKKIGKIFRGHNIIEYKSPKDHLSVNDFYKVYGYTCFYQSNTDNIREIAPEDLTITFASSHYPKELFQHLKETRNIEIEYQHEGIYYLKGDFIPMQFLCLPKLDKDENYWLQSLRNNLKAGEEIRTLMSNYEKHRTSKDYSAVMNLITRANWEQMEVEKKMCDALNELFAEELKEADLRGRTEGLRLGRSEGLQLGKSEGLRLGKAEGLHQATIETCQEVGLNYQDTYSRVKEKYQLTEDETRTIMEKHWKFT